VTVARPATTVYAPVAPAINYSNIPVVDCVPYPTRNEYCSNGCM